MPACRLDQLNVFIYDNEPYNNLFQLHGYDYGQILVFSVCLSDYSAQLTQVGDGNYSQDVENRGLNALRKWQDSKRYGNIRDNLSNDSTNNKTNIRLLTGRFR